MTEDQFYEIYNRACTENGGPEPIEGDRALTGSLMLSVSMQWPELP